MQCEPVPPFLDTLLTNTGVSWLRLDPAGKVIAASESASLLLCSKSISEGPVPGWRQMLARLRPYDRSLRQFCRLNRPSGETLHAWINVLRAGEGVYDVLVIACDELQAMHAALDDARGRYRSVLEQSQNGVFVAAGNRFVFVNDALAEMLAYRRADLLDGPWSAIVHEGDHEAIAGIYGALQSGEAEAGEFTVRLWMKDRIGLREVSIRASRVWYEDDWCILGTVYDITDLRRGEAALRDYARRLRLLSQQVINVQENERRHLARELHDEIGQQLTLVKLSLEALREDGTDNDALRNALSNVTILTQQIRDMSLDLRPSMLDDLGLGATLRWYATRAADVAGLHLALHIDADFPRLAADAETLFFRISQEAITNVLRHARARSLDVELSASNGGIELIIADDGCGFDLGAVTEAALQGSSSGLLGMQERATLGGATLEIESAPGKGAWLKLSIAEPRAIPQ